MNLDATKRQWSEKVEWKWNFSFFFFEYLCRRNQNYTNILRFLNLGDKKLNPFDITHRFTHLFWLGDLNYRVDFPPTVSWKERSLKCRNQTGINCLLASVSLNPPKMTRRLIRAFEARLDVAVSHRATDKAARQQSESLLCTVPPLQEAEYIVTKIKQQQYQELLSKDQLNMERNDGKVFLHFGEAHRTDRFSLWAAWFAVWCIHLTTWLKN